MKVALLTDTHWGIRSDSDFFLNNMKTFLDEIFFPYLTKHKIKKIIHLGDVVDRQKYINYNTARRLRQDFLEPIVEKNIDMDVILGNHDYYYKQITDVNAFHELLRDYPTIKTYLSATDVKLGNTTALYVPWLCNQNREQSEEVIKKSKASVVFGHLELNGFEMHKGVFHHGGDNPDMFGRFDLVCSGHYHHRSSYNNINYLGSPCQFTWSDYGDPRGFHVFDTVSRELTFIQNPHAAFEKIFYDDTGRTPEDLFKNVDFSKLRKKFIKVIVHSKTNIPLFDEFILRIEEQGPINMSIVDDHLNLDLISDTTIETEAKDTLTIFREFIKQSNTIVNAEKLDNLVVGLYQRAIAID